jgi:hypothetical protein
MVFWIDAVFSLATGVLFLLGTWDGLYNDLDLPQHRPAIFVQAGGAVLLGVAYLLWLATRTDALALPLARASAIMNAVSVAVVVAWLVHGKLGIGSQGKAELIATTVVMAAFTAVYLAAGIRHGGYGSDPG